jgi:hypothetical protein
MNPVSPSENKKPRRDFPGFLVYAGILVEQIFEPELYTPGTSN